MSRRKLVWFGVVIGCGWLLPPATSMAQTQQSVAGFELLPSSSSAAAPDAGRSAPEQPDSRFPQVSDRQAPALSGLGVVVLGGLVVIGWRRPSRQDEN